MVLRTNENSFDEVLIIVRYKSLSSLHVCQQRERKSSLAETGELDIKKREAVEGRFVPKSGLVVVVAVVVVVFSH